MSTPPIVHSSADDLKAFGPSSRGASSSLTPPTGTIVTIAVTVPPSIIAVQIEVVVRRSGCFRCGWGLGLVRIEGPNAARSDGPPVAFQSPRRGLLFGAAANGQQDGQCQSDIPQRAHGRDLLPFQSLTAGLRPRRHCVSP